MPDVESCVSSGNAVANWGFNGDQEHERICWKIPAIFANLKGLREHSSDVAKPEVGIQWCALTAWKIPTLSRAVATFAILQHNTFAITWYSNNNKMITITTKWAMQRCHTITGLSKSYSFQRTKYLFVDQKLESIHWTNWPWLIALWSLCCFKLHVVIYVKTIGPYHIIRPRSVRPPTPILTLITGVRGCAGSTLRCVFYYWNKVKSWNIICAFITTDVCYC